LYRGYPARGDPVGCPIRCVYVRKGVMPVLRIVVDGWMGGCNARFKDCCG